MKQYVILLARRSTDGQEESLKYQIEKVQNHFRQYTPDKIVKITETGDNKTDNPRKKFNEEFLQLIKQKIKQENNVICITHAIDRLTRNYKDLGTIESLYQQGVKFFALDGKLENDQDAMQFGIMVAFAKNFLTNMKKKQKDGLVRKIREGRVFCGHIPGYIPTKVTGVRKVDPIKKKAILKFFEDYATGKYSLNSYLPIAQKIGKMYGVKISSIERLRKILRNKFYIGLYEYQGKHEELKGEVITHISDKLIPKDLFNKVQNVLNSRHLKKVSKHDFLYRGKIRTTNGNLLIGSYKKNKKYVYYEDQKTKLKALNETDIDFAVHDFLIMTKEKMNIKNFKKQIKKNLNQTLGKIENEEKTIKLEIAKIDKEMKKLRKQRRDEEITKEEFFEDRADLIERKNSLLQKNIEDITDKLNAFDQCQEEFLELFETFNVSYLKLPRTIKVNLLKNWIWNFSYNGEKLSIQPSPLFKLLTKPQKIQMVEMVQKNWQQIREEVSLIARLFGG